MVSHFKTYKKQINGNSIHKIRQKVRKKILFPNYRGEGHGPFGQGVATPMFRPCKVAVLQH